MTVTTKGSLKLRAVPSTAPEKPVNWKFKTVDFGKIRSEYNAIREKSSRDPKNIDSIRADHSAFANKYPQLFWIATSPEICDQNVHLILDLSENAQKSGRDELDKEATLFGQQMWDQYADPNRKLVRGH